MSEGRRVRLYTGGISFPLPPELSAAFTQGVLSDLRDTIHEANRVRECELLGVDPYPQRSAERRAYLRSWRGRIHTWAHRHVKRAGERIVSVAERHAPPQPWRGVDYIDE